MKLKRSILIEIESKNNYMLHDDKLIIIKKINLYFY